MTSQIPAATTHLFNLAKRSVVGEDGAVVHDGWTDERSSVMFGISVQAPPFFEAEEQAAIQAFPQWVGIGPPFMDEDFIIPGYIYVGVGGTDYPAVRTRAFAIWDKFVPLIRADLTLGGTVYIAEIPSLTARGPRSHEEAQGGRYCLIQFGIRGKDEVYDN